jgi:hypothetical protein
MMEGVKGESGFLDWVRSEFRRDRERVSVGGGDFKRGEMGQWGVLSPELDPDDPFTGRGSRGASCVDVGGSGGVLAEDSARWMAAAEGMVALEPAKLGPLLGLTSVLLLRDRSPDLGSATGGPGWRCDGRVGDVSREDMGELWADTERALEVPLRVLCL